MKNKKSHQKVKAKNVFSNSAMSPSLFYDSNNYTQSNGRLDLNYLNYEYGSNVSTHQNLDSYLNHGMQIFYCYSKFPVNFYLFPLLSFS